MDGFITAGFGRFEGERGGISRYLYAIFGARSQRNVLLRGKAKEQEGTLPLPNYLSTYPGKCEEATHLLRNALLKEPLLIHAEQR